jgi:hypothetical protein
MARRFPPPWSVEEQVACFVVLVEKDKTAGPMSDAKSELQLIDTHGEPEPSGLFRLSYGTEPNDPVPFILTLTPQYVARAIGKTAPTDIRNYAEQNADKLKAIATFEKARGVTAHTLE